MRVAQGRAWTPQTATSDSHGAGRSSRSKNLSVTRYEPDAIALSTNPMKQGAVTLVDEEEWDDGLRGGSKARGIA